MIKHVVLLTGPTPMSFSEARLRSRCAGTHRKKKHRKRRLPSPGSEYRPIDRAIEWGLRTFQCRRIVLNVYTIAPRIAPPNHSFSAFNSAIFVLACARRTHRSHTTMTWGSSRVQASCVLHAASRRRYSHDECTRWTSSVKLKHRRLYGYGASRYCTQGLKPSNIRVTAHWHR